MIYSVILFCVTLVLFEALYLLKKFSRFKFNRKLLVILAIVLFAFTFFRQWMSDNYIFYIKGGTLWEFSYPYSDPIEAIVRWIFMFAKVLIFTSIVVDNKYVKKTMSLVALPLLILTISYFDKSLAFYTVNNHLLLINLPNGWVIFLVMLDYILTMAIPFIYHLVDDNKLSDLKEKHEILSMVKISAISILICVPMRSIINFFGPTTIDLQFGSLPQIFWIISIVGIGLLIHYLFRKESKDTRFAIIAIMTFYLFLHYGAVYSFGFKMSRIPLQLCNAACVFFVVLLFCRSQKFFDFVYLANPVGAVVAVATLAEPGMIFNFWVLHYIIQHTWVLLIPILMVTLGIFEEPKIKKMNARYFIFFTGFYLLCFVVDAVEHGFLIGKYGVAKGFNGCNFLYLLKCPVSDILTFEEALHFGGFKIGDAQFYIGYLMFIYVVFSALVYVVYFAEYGLFRLTDLVHKLNFKKSENNL